MLSPAIEAQVLRDFSGLLDPKSVTSPVCRVFSRVVDDERPDPVYARLELDAAFVRRLIELLRIVRERELISVTVDNLPVAWSVDPDRSTLVTVFEGWVEMEGVRAHPHRGCVKAVWAVDDEAGLQSLLDGPPPWDEVQVGGNAPADHTRFVDWLRVQLELIGDGLRC